MKKTLNESILGVLGWGGQQVAGHLVGKGVDKVVNAGKEKKKEEREKKRDDTLSDIKRGIDDLSSRQSDYPPEPIVKIVRVPVPVHAPQQAPNISSYQAWQDQNRQQIQQHLRTAKQKRRGSSMIEEGFWKKKEYKLGNAEVSPAEVDKIRDEWKYKTPKEHEDKAKEYDRSIDMRIGSDSATRQEKLKDSMIAKKWTLFGRVHRDIAQEKRSSAGKIARLGEETKIPKVNSLYEAYAKVYAENTLGVQLDEVQFNNNPPKAPTRLPTNLRDHKRQVADEMSHIDPEDIWDKRFSPTPDSWITTITFQDGKYHDIVTPKTFMKESSPPYFGGTVTDSFDTHDGHHGHIEKLGPRLFKAVFLRSGTKEPIVKDADTKDDARTKMSLITRNWIK